MERPKYAEMVAIFDDEETYNACLPALEELRQKHNFDYISESVEEGEDMVPMSTGQISNEINAQIEFKFGEFMTGLKNRVGFKWAGATDRDGVIVWQIHKEIEEMIDKEIKMPVPADMFLSQDRKRELKDQAIEDLQEIIKRTTRGIGHIPVNTLVQIIERAQNY